MSTSTFDTLPAAAATKLVAPCCASRAWQTAVVAGRPYGGLDALLRAARTALAAVAWDDVLEALAAHPRIGRRAGGSGTEARWSRAEQAAAATTDAGVVEQLHAGNVAYEQRFGTVFLICATGKAPDQVLAALTRRLDHDDETERAEVRAQLAQIVDLRLRKVFAP